MIHPDIDGFRDHLLSLERTKNTIDSYIEGLWQYFARFSDISAENVLAFKQHLMQKFKPKTCNVRLNAIKAYAKFLGMEPLKVKGIKIGKALSVENVISPKEFKQLCDGLKADGKLRGYWIVMFLAKTGARVSEFCRFTKTGLEHGYEEIWTKGKIRRIYFPSFLIKDSREYFASVPGHLLFPSRFNKQMTSRGVSSNLQKWGAMYGIRKEVMHPHGFRHFYAKEFLKNSNDLTLLSDLLGHESLDTTALYTRKTRSEMTIELSRIMGGM